MNIQQSNISGPMTSDSTHLERELETSGSSRQKRVLYERKASNKSNKHKNKK